MHYDVIKWKHFLHYWPFLWPGTGEFPAQRPVMRSFDVFFDLCPDKRLSIQWWGWWFELLSSPLWRHCNGSMCFVITLLIVNYGDVPLWCDQFSSQWTPHGLPIRARYGVCFVSVTLIYEMLGSVQCCLKYHVILDLIMMAPSCHVLNENWLYPTSHKHSNCYHQSKYTNEWNRLIHPCDSSGRLGN